MQLTFDIPDEAVGRITAAINGLFPVPVDTAGKPVYTESQWAKERIRRLIVEIVYKYELKSSIRVAQDTIQKDDSLVT